MSMMSSFAIYAVAWASFLAPSAVASSSLKIIKIKKNIIKKL